ncbi:MAG TPA: TetR/AcrR family transcriptional regulator [Nitrososphaerales archaeon]|nr:TetR/AcrR family transcriptional regulator [Nitrososphaerales archaeon]
MRDPERTRAAILEAAYTQIYQHGFQATSIDEIVAKASMTKGAFFCHFHSKKDLGYALVEEVLKEETLDRWIRPVAAYKNPVQGIITRFRKAIESTTEEHMGLGCPLNNLVQEMSAVDPVFREKLQAILLLWIEETEKYLKKAQAEGYIKKNVNVRQVAEFVVMVEEGSFAMVKNLRDKKVYWALYESLKQYLESISEKPGEAQVPLVHR